MTKYCISLLNKIEYLIDQKKVSFLETKDTKLDDIPKKLRGLQHEKNKNMGIFNNPFLNFRKRQINEYKCQLYL